MAPGTGRRLALLRGINVGGHRLLRMTDLRELAQRLGLRDVSTVGASGNLVYSSARSLAADASALEEALERRLGRAHVIVRDGAQMADLVKEAPFRRPDAVVPDQWRFVAFLAAASRAELPDVPTAAAIEFVGRRPREVFYAMREPSMAAVGIAGRLERALGTPITVRNWNVVRTLARLLDEGPVAHARPPAPPAKAPRAPSKARGASPARRTR